jgi:hypothetical protein
LLGAAMCRALRAGFVVPPLVCLRLDPDENGAPESVELSRAGAPGALQFGFDALDGVFRPESRNEFLDAAPQDAHEDALFVWRGRKVAVAIDLGHPAANTFGRPEVMSPAAQKSTLGWTPVAGYPITNACFVADG